MVSPTSLAGTLCFAVVVCLTAIATTIGAADDLLPNAVLVPLVDVLLDDDRERADTYEGSAPFERAAATGDIHDASPCLYMAVVRRLPNSAGDAIHQRRAPRGPPCGKTEDVRLARRRRSIPTYDLALAATISRIDAGQFISVPEPWFAAETRR